jgi:peroxiredoxin Q/BCP
LKEKGGRLLAVAVDSPQQSRRVVEGNDLPFPILCDTEREVVRAYGLLHEDGGQTGDIAIPAHILIDRGGRIVWRRLSDKVQDRPDPQEVLQQVERL